MPGGARDGSQLYAIQEYPRAGVFPKAHFHHVYSPFTSETCEGTVIEERICSFNWAVDHDSVDYEKMLHGLCDKLGICLCQIVNAILFCECHFAPWAPPEKLVQRNLVPSILNVAPLPNPSTRKMNSLHRSLDGSWGGVSQPG